MRRVVVIGYGMAGARLAEELRRRDPDARRTAITVIGEEPVPAYNRVLLIPVMSEDIAPDAVYLHDDGWAARHHVSRRLGVSALAVDPAARAVTLSNGETLGYDALVLATGSRPRLPQVRGLTAPGGGPAPGVLTLRSLDDCALIAKQVSADAPVAVLGGGVLGLEAAHALATRASRVTVVHPTTSIMDRQLDHRGSRTLTRLLRAAGLEFRLGRFATEFVPGEGLTLDDGSRVAAAGVLVTAGVRPETSLAANAGLAVDRGVVVDDTLRTSEPRVFAIGDCAQHPGTPGGFVQPAWEQAGVLADLLSGADPGARYRGTTVVARLKAPGIDLAALGNVHVDDDAEDHEVVSFTDPTRGRYAKIVLRGDSVRGAVFVGFPDAAARTAYHYHNGTPVPSDRLSVLFGREGDSFGQSTEDLVCRCNSVKEVSLVAAWRDGARSVSALASATRATTGCGTCLPAVMAIAERLTG
jgi:assimilatory nitrate reductase electron transfer subunit